MLNPAHECLTVLDYPVECVLYLELIGASIIVLLTTLFINIAICRRPAGIGHDADEFRASQGKSLKTLKGKLKEHKQSEKVTLYYKFGIDAMEEVRISQAPASIPNGFRKRDIKCCDRTMTLKVPSFKLIGFVGITSLWTLGMLAMSFFVHRYFFGIFLVKISIFDVHYQLLSRISSWWSLSDSS